MSVESWLTLVFSVFFAGLLTGWWIRDYRQIWYEQGKRDATEEHE